MSNLSIYRYGSRVYGTHTDKSDHDFIVVYDELESREVHRSNFSINYFSIGDFKNKLAICDISALECLFLPKKYVIKEAIEFYTLISLDVLRKSISEKVSHSWVKAKKKFEVECDVISGRKSLFHAFRIAEFGKQIAEYGKIEDYSAANDIWFKYLMNLTSEGWKENKQFFKERHNKLMSEFRMVAPKGG